MMKTGSNILVHFVELQPAGYKFNRNRNAWPLHITLVPWFFVDTTKQDNLDVELRAFCERAEPLTVRVGGIELFGTIHTIPVNVMDDSIALTELHLALLNMINNNGAEPQASNEYIGASYRPHITRHADYGSEKGAVVRVDTVSLVSVDARDMCTVERTFMLGLRDEATA